MDNKPFLYCGVTAFQGCCHLELAISCEQVPHITESCMTTYQDEAVRTSFICNDSKRVHKKNGRVCVFTCTLVDDDDAYDLGGTLADAMQVRVMLRQHRWYSCFTCGVSCREPEATEKWSEDTSVA